MTFNRNKIVKYIVNMIIEKSYGSRLGNFIINKICYNFINQKTIVAHKNVHLEFTTSNPTSKWRAKTLSFKEPETLQ